MQITLILMAILPASPETYGKSTEDLVGVFSIEKTIKLGSSSSCFTAAGKEGQDPLDASLLQSAPRRSPMGDDQPPGLAALNIAVDPPNALVFLGLHILDDQSGMKEGRANFSGPAGAVRQALILPQNLTNGTPRNGLYVVRMSMPDSGDWVLEDLTLEDAAGNQKVLKSAELLNLSMPPGFHVP